VDVLVREHQEILDMLGLRDNEGLQRAISNHMRKAVDDLNAIQQNRADRRASPTGTPVEMHG
jgi:DNA-binding GntR family transcriptional regulator